MTADGRPRAVVIGAGPAGLTAAYLLVRRDVSVVVVERDAQVGGLARTVEYKGYRFDIGGHRFFTKVGPVRDLWRAMLGPDMLRRPRLSRIYYRGRFFDYPLKPLNVLRGLGPLEAFLVVASYVRARLRPIRPEVSVEDWVSNRFGRRLFRLFFKTYTEKVWGIPCNQIGAQWAAQRIKGLSLVTAVANMLFRRRGRSGAIKTLIEEFEYPRLGPGMMWEAFRADIEGRGGTVLLSTPVTRLHHEGGRVTAVEVERDGRPVRLEADFVLSTMPLRELVESLSPAAPPEVWAAGAALKYRDFLTVALILDVAELFPDNWIYVHDPRVRLGRIQNFKNWSPDMVPDPRRTCLGLEYFCFEGDGLWTMSDEELIALGARELDLIGLLRGARVVDGTVVRMPKAYPIYDEGYERALEVVRRYLDGFANLQVAGRNGMHKYNNQDHSMVTAILAVQNFFGARHDVWAVNADDEYHEEELGGGPSLGELDLLEATQPMVPRPLPAAAGRREQSM
jgi:protoporphyrinogen oxidase